MRWFSTHLLCLICIMAPALGRVVHIPRQRRQRGKGTANTSQSRAGSYRCSFLYNMLNAIFGMLLTHALCQHDHEGDKYLLYFWRCIFMAWQQWLMHHPCPTGKADGRSPKSTPALGGNFTKLRRVRTRRSYAVNCHIFKVLVEQQRNTQINSFSLEVREKCRIDFWIGGEVFEALPKLLESNDYDQFCLDLQWHSINSYLQSQTSACCIMLHAWARP